MSIKQRILDNAEIYIGGTILLPLALAGFYATMDARHDRIGAAAEAEERAIQAVVDLEERQAKNAKNDQLRVIRREIRKLQNYEMLSPNSTYSASRQKEIADLKDEEREILEQ